MTRRLLSILTLGLVPYRSARRQQAHAATIAAKAARRESRRR